MEAREIGHLKAQVQSNWDKLFHFMENQKTAVSTLTNELKQSSVQHDSQWKSLSDQVDSHTQQISNILSQTKQQTESEVFTTENGKAINNK